MPNEVRKRKKQGNTPKVETRPSNEPKTLSKEEILKKQSDLIIDQIFRISEKAVDRSWSIVTFVLFLIVCILSFGTRFYNVEQPNAVLFDEVHFVSMSQWYSARKYFFDIHPPLGKLCLAAIAYLVGFHTDEPYRDIGKVYLDDNYKYMRYLPAFFGSTLGPICFLIVKHMTGSDIPAFIAGLFIVFELGLQTISRAILLDSMLHSLMFFSLYAALKVWSYNEEITKENRSYWKFWLWSFICAISLGLAFGVKHTALGIIGVVGLLQIVKCFSPLIRYVYFHFISSPKDQKLMDYNFPSKHHVKITSWFNRMFLSGILMIFMIIFIHFILFYIHFVVIKYTGVDEDSMSDNYRSQLIGSLIPMPAGETPQGMLKNIYDINVKMIEVNRNVYYEGYYISPWYEWPIMWKGVMYHWETFDGYHECVYLFGNPVLYWIVLLSVIVGVFYVDRLSYKQIYGIINGYSRQVEYLFICILGYFSNILPYPILIARPCYMYHYHPSLIFGILFLSTMINSITKKKINRVVIALILLIPVIISYWHFLPFSYAIPLTDEEHNARRWFPNLFPYW